MSDSVKTSVLINCTLEVINKFPGLVDTNSSEIISSNRTEILDILGGIVAKYRSIHGDTDINTLFKEFITECLFVSPTRPYELPWQQKSAWAVLFGAMLLVAITGNCIVLWIVLAHRRMRTVTNYFLLNLSIADLLMASLNCVFNFIFMIDSDWPFGAIYCTINNFIANVSVASSVFTLVAISFDRYIAIVRPLQHRTSRKKARIFLAIIWLMSCVLAVPCLMYSSVMTKKYTNGKTRTVCYMLWPDGRYPTSRADYIYNLVFLILTYGIPIMIMVICYTLMGRELWGSRSIGEHTERQLESMKSKKKVVRMFIIIVAIFAICWLPYHLFFVYSYHNHQMTSSSYVQHLYLGFYWLAMSNAMVNPIIYYWMNSRFRVYFQHIICFCCLKIWESRHKNETPPGILLGKNSNSDPLGRTRSCRNKTTMSVKWRQSTGETRIRHVNPLTPISPRSPNTTIPENTQLALKECVKMNNNNTINGTNNDMTKTTSLLATSNVSPTDKSMTFNYLKAQNGNAVVTSVNNLNNHHNLNLSNNNNNNNINNINTINNSVASNNNGGLSEYYSCS